MPGWAGGRAMPQTPASKAPRTGTAGRGLVSSGQAVEAAATKILRDWPPGGGSARGGDDDFPRLPNHHGQEEPPRPGVRAGRTA